MQLIEFTYSSLEQEIKEEEFRYWDACRNGCSEVVLQKIEEKIATLKAHVLLKTVTKISFEKEKQMLQPVQK